MRGLLKTIGFSFAFSFSSLALATLTHGDGQISETARNFINTVDGNRIKAADQDAGNWLTYGRDYREQRYSPLEQINDKNANKLGLAWFWETGTSRGLEATPLIADGVMYTTGTFSEVYALDAKTGRLIWKNDLNVDRSRSKYACCDAVNRGVALWKGKVYVGAIDGRLIALDAATGEIAWETMTVDPKQPYAISGAPRVANGKVFIGNGGAEYGVRGYVTAYDADTGKQIWRFYAVPGSPDKFEDETMAMAAKTWDPKGDWWKVGAGGVVWNTIVYDPELNLLYLGTGNGTPWNKYIRSPAGGDNLFTSSIVAVNADTGKYVWHYQINPAEGWDYDASEDVTLATLKIDGQDRQVLMQAPKNGFFYVIDRHTGKLISANNFTPVSWASRIDLRTGRPVETNNSYKDRTVLQFPSPLGAHSWMAQCYSPKTGYVYIPTQEMVMAYNSDPDFEYKPGNWNIGLLVMKSVVVPTWVDPRMVQKLASASASGYLQAWDPIKQKRVWKVSHNGMWNGGTLCTGGNVVFQGTGDGKLFAYSADTGRKLWSYDVQHPIIAPPVTYTVDGQQYVSVMAGWGGAVGLSFGPVGNPPEPMYPKGRILTFKLDSNAQLPPLVRQDPKPQPPDIQVSSAVLDKGNKLYHENCVYCHGPGGMGNPNMGDLRYMDAKAHAQFMATMYGAMESKGMPSFAGTLNPEEAEAIHAYLAKLGHQVAVDQQSSTLWHKIKDVLYAGLAVVTHAFMKVFIWFMNAGN
jgi:quinohemoprotein ethanol dehydrogenase